MPLKTISRRSSIWSKLVLVLNEKLKRDNIQSKTEANQTHFEVGQKVRETIKELGGTMPENLPTPEKSIRQLAQKEAKKKKIDK